MEQPDDSKGQPDSVNPLACNDWLSAVLPDIRVFGCPQDGSQDRLEMYRSMSVPRVGDHICVQHWTAEVYRVEWTIINGRPHADVFCDTSEIARELSR